MDRDPALRRGVAYLTRLQRPSGAITAFDDTIFDVWETLAALRAILEIEGLSSRPVVEAGLSFVASTEREGGRLLHTSDFTEGSCLEVTSEAISVRIAARRASILEDDVDRDLLDTIRSEQTPFGCWAILSPSIPAALQTFPSATAFALLALGDGGVEPVDLDGARMFLRATQHDEGHWGAPWHFYGTPYYAMAPILEALRADPKADGVRRWARRFLEDDQADDGSWRRGEPSAELQTALAMRAALAAGAQPQDRGIQAAAGFLRRSQRGDGGWCGGTFPLPSSMGRVQREDVYATAQALRALVAMARGSAQ
jgi:hypothetical protein